MLVNNNDPIIADGFSAKEWVNMLHTDRSAAAMKSLNYLDGNQEAELIIQLNQHRRNWKQKGLIPRTRNLTSMVIEKSGMLFKDAMPVMEVFADNSTTPDAVHTALFNEMLTRTDFTEFMNNFDQVVRLLKTGIILEQWDSELGQPCFDILHRGNCEVVMDPQTKRITSMIYRSADNMYSVWTNDQIITLWQAENEQITILSSEENTYGTIPISVFYDVRTPRTGFWMEQDCSLVSINEVYNLHLTDAEYSVLWQKMSTLFTNMSANGNGDDNMTHLEVNYRDKLPRLHSGSGMDPSVMAGPGSAVVLNSQGVDSPFVRYENPRIDLKPIQEVVDAWVQSFAADWSVRLQTAGSGSASSGFQLIVEEMDNLDLRKRRQRMMEAGMKRFYTTFVRVFNHITRSDTFSEETDLFVVFNEPVLPVDPKEEEAVWDVRIAAGRASDLDYFKHKEGLTKEEAMAKIQEIVEYNEWKAGLTAPVVTVAQPEQVNTAGNAADTQQEQQPPIED